MPFLPAPDLRNRRNGHAPHTAAPDPLVLGNLSVRNRQKGISAVQLGHTLGICYDSAWHLLDRISTAMGKRDEKYLLSGIVELDDGYVGGASHNGKRGRGTNKAKIVVAAISCGVLS